MTYAMGCLGHIPSVNDYRFPAGVVARAVGSIPSAVLDSIPAGRRRDQEDRNSCVGQSIIDCLESEGEERGHLLDLSIAFGWWLGRDALGGTNENMGCFARDMLDGMRVHGVPHAALMPESTPYNVPPSKAARANAINHRVTEYYAVSGAAEARVAIANGNPVAFAFVTYNNFHDERVRTTGMFPVPVGKMRGAHQVVAKGYDDTKVVPGWPAGAFLVKNWWGDWGIPHPVFASTAKVGYWWYPYAAFNDPQQTFGCWTIHGVPLLESI